MRDAIDKGLTFLDSCVGNDGQWPSWIEEVADGRLLHHEGSPFFAMVGVLVLSGIEDPRARSVMRRTRRRISETMFYPGIWKYWSSLPADADDAAIGSLAVGLHPWLLVGRNVELLLRHRNDDGLFLTWFEGRTPDNDVDSVVNANVVAYLGDNTNTRPAQEWLTSLVEDGGHLSETMVYYKEDVDLYGALVRASEYGKPAFAGLRPKLAELIGNVRTEEGAYGDPLRTAQALDALAALDALPSSPHLEQTLDFILSRQETGGQWSGSPASYGPRPPHPIRTLAFCSPAYDTALCVGALHKITTLAAG